MNNEEPQGVGGSVAEAAPPPTNEVTSPNIPSMPEAPAPPAQAPSLGGIGSVMPGGNMNETSGPAAIAANKTQEASANASANKGGSKLNPLNWFKTSYEATSDKTQASPQTGGILPGVTPLPEAPPAGANPNLVNNQTPEMPNVTPEATAAVSAPAETATASTGIEAPSGAVSDEPASTGETQTSTPAGTPASASAPSETPTNPTIDATVTDAPATPGIETPVETKTDEPNDGTAIHPFDTNVAAEGKAADDANNAQDLDAAQNAARESLDVKEPITPKLGDQPMEDEAPKEPEAPVVNVSNAQPIDEEVTFPDNSAHIDASAPHPDAPVVGQEVRDEAKMDTPDKLPDAPVGSLSYETTPPVHEGEDPAEQWMKPPTSTTDTASNPVGFGGESTNPAVTATPSTQTHTSPDTTMPADKAAVEEEIPAPSATALSERPTPEDTGTTPSETAEEPTNVTPIRPDVTIEPNGPGNAAADTAPNLSIVPPIESPEPPPPAASFELSTPTPQEDSNSEPGSGTGTPPAQAA